MARSVLNPGIRLEAPEPFSPVEEPSIRRLHR